MPLIHFFNFIYICLFQTLGPYKSMNEHNIKIIVSNKVSELKQVLIPIVKICCTGLDYKYYYYY